MRRLLLLTLFIPVLLSAQSADQKKTAVRFLTSLQQPDGGYLTAPADPKSSAPPRSSLRATSGAVRAIKYLGGEIPNRDQARAFVRSCYVPETGAFADVPGGKADSNTTAIGLMAMAELHPDFAVDKSVQFLADNARTFEERRLAVAGMEAAKRFARPVKEWLAEIEKSRNPDGTYGTGDGQARETGGIAAMILRSGGTLSDEHRRSVVAALQAAQRPDGGYGKADAKGSDTETTYRVMRAFHLLKEQPKEVARLREFLAKHRNADGGFGVTPGQPSTVSGTYYVAVIGFWLAK